MTRLAIAAIAAASALALPASAAASTQQSDAIPCLPVTEYYNTCDGLYTDELIKDIKDLLPVS